MKALEVTNAQIVVPMVILYGGISQYITGLFELLSGNTFGGAVFGSYGAFNLTYGSLFLPAFGIKEAYTVDGQPSSEYSGAIALFLWCWFTVTIFFIIGAFRSTLAVLLTLFATALSLGTLAASFQYSMSYSNSLHVHLY